MRSFSPTELSRWHNKPASSLAPEDEQPTCGRPRDPTIDPYRNPSHNLNTMEKAPINHLYRVDFHCQVLNQRHISWYSVIIWYRYPIISPFLSGHTGESSSIFQYFFTVHFPFVVGGLEHVSFSHILGILIPTDFQIFQMGFSSTNQIYVVGEPTSHVCPASDPHRPEAEAHIQNVCGFEWTAGEHLPGPPGNNGPSDHRPESR